MTTAKSVPPPRPRKHRKRFLIPAVVAALLVLFLIGAIVRGTWADTVAKDPATSAEGVTCQVFQVGDGPKHVRCALVLDHPIEKVWATVTDYDHFTEIFPTLRSAQAERLPTGKTRLTGEALALYGVWSFDILVSEMETPESRIVSWTGSGGNVSVIQGKWTLTPLGPDRTLLVYASQVEVKGFPDWFVRNVLLHRQPKVMAAVAAWLDQ
jgi:uncharacterized protein YndB with AHSA1/START domain